MPRPCQRSAIVGLEVHLTAVGQRLTGDRHPGGDRVAITIDGRSATRTCPMRCCRRRSETQNRWASPGSSTAFGPQAPCRDRGTSCI